MQNEMIALILKDLPNQTAGVLKSYLDEAEKNKTALAEANRQLHNANSLLTTKGEQIGKLSSEVQDLKGKIVAQDAMTKRELDMEKRERNLELEVLRNLNQSLQREGAAVMELARAAFRNPVIMRSENKSVPVASQGGNGCAGYVSNYPESKTTTETVD